MIMDTQSVVDSKTGSTVNPFEDENAITSGHPSSPTMGNNVLRRSSPSRSSIDKSAFAWAEQQQQETPPLYALPENASTIAPSATLVGSANPPPAHEPVSEQEWLETLRELQKNLAMLNFARRAGAKRKSGPRRFVRSLFNSKSFKKGAQTSTSFGESDIERQERVQSIRVLEELVLGGMRRLARIHPEQDARTDWHLRAEQFAETIRKGESANNLDQLLANEKEKETILEGLAKGLALLFLTPVALSGVVIFGTGAMIYGVGKCTVALGHVMTFGKFR